MSETMERKLLLSGFGSRCCRFNTVGIHPGRLKYGNAAITSHSHIGPGSYECKSWTSHAKDLKGGWKRQVEVERWSKIPYFACKEDKEKERDLTKKLGPGRYLGIDNNTNDENIHKNGLMDSMVPRFASSVSDEFGFPGPGYYDASKDIAKKKDFATKGQLSSGSKRMNDKKDTIGLGPGAYEIKGSIDELLNKSGSCFSLDRNKSMTNGCKSIRVTNDLGPGQYDVTPSIKTSGGKFARLGRDFKTCANLDLPGPGQYNPRPIGSIGSFPTNLPPFMSNTSRNRLITKAFLQGNSGVVGPGRYDVIDRRIVEPLKSGRRNCSVSKRIQGS